MLELAVLGLLAEQPLHGYELKKRLSETLGPLWGISFGSLYPALRRLERSGAIEATETQEPSRRRQPSRPDRSTVTSPRPACARRALPGRRTRKAYRITDTGRTLFAELLTDDSTDDERTFALKLSFCRYLDAADRLALLERRRNQLTDRLSKAAPRAQPDHRPLHPVAPRAPGPFHPARSRVDRRADRRRAREPDRRPHRRSSISMSGPTAPRNERVRESASRSPASGTARAASCRASSSTATPIRTSACPA